MAPGRGWGRDLVWVAVRVLVVAWGVEVGKGGGRFVGGRDGKGGG